MKKSVYKKTHIGNQPIRVLKHNITTRLGDFIEPLIEELKTEKKLTPYVKYNIADLPLFGTPKQTPFINENGEINIQETFNSFLWIVSFSVFVFYEEAVVKPQSILRNEPNSKKPNEDLIELTKELFQYGKSLIISFSEWDKNYLPNPEFFDEKSEESFYILRNNDLFINAMNFIMCHEIAHAELEHIKNKKENNLKGDDIKNLEREADKRAIELMLKDRDSTKIKSIELGIFIGIFSLIFFSHNYNGGDTHPDTDERILNFLDVIKPKDEDSIWAIGCLFIKLWDEQFSHNLIYKQKVENFKELFNELYEQSKKL